MRRELQEGQNTRLKISVDLGGEQRQVFAGIKAAYDPPQQLIGRLAILAAGPGGSEIFLLSADTGAEPGMRVK